MFYIRLNERSQSDKFILIYQVWLQALKNSMLNTSRPNTILVIPECCYDTLVSSAVIVNTVKNKSVMGGGEKRKYLKAIN